MATQAPSAGQQMHPLPNVEPVSGGGGMPHFAPAKWIKTRQKPKKLVRGLRAASRGLSRGHR